MYMCIKYKIITILLLLYYIEFFADFVSTFLYFTKMYNGSFYSN